MSVTLRPYQQQAVTSTIDYLETGNPLVVAPTGSGKTHIIAGICLAITNKYPDARVLILSHVKEILAQNADKLRHYVPPEEIGVYSSGLGCKDIKRYTIASIQTVCLAAKLFLDFNYIIVDEAHLIPPSGEGRYRGVFNVLKHARVIGLTATPYRLGHGYLTDNHMFDKIVYDIDILELMDQGYLARLVTKQPVYEMNVQDVKVVAGDYSKRSLSEELDSYSVTFKIVQELLKYKNTRKHWLIFAIDIAHAEHIATLLHANGITSAAVHSQLDFNRDILLGLFKDGSMQALVSVETLTTGFDAPNVDLVALMRPTQSPVLHVQMIGRGMRTADGKKDCLILDFAGNTKRLGPINDIRIAAKREKGKSKEGKAPTRTCPECSEILPIQTKVCLCGHVFPPPVDLTTKASQIEVIKDKKKSIKEYITKFEVKAVHYHIHKKIGGLPSLKVVYSCGLRSFSEHIGFEHPGFPRRRAEAWWNQRTRLVSVPSTVADAHKRVSCLIEPRAIYVNESGTFPEIIRYEF